MYYTFDFEKLLTENGFIPNFELTIQTQDFIGYRDILNSLSDDVVDDFEENWFDYYTAQLNAFVSSNRLFRVDFKSVDDFSQLCVDTFYTDNKSKLIDWLYPDYCPIDDYGCSVYTKEQFADSLEFVVE